MFLHNNISDQLLLLVAILAAVCCSPNELVSSRKDDRLVLSPAEVIDMVWEEQRQGKDTPGREHISKIIDLGYQDEEAVKDEEMLKSRKVWSRWSKWSKCTVTCGAGSFTRRRLCVAGRCAPGEREEQHRACALSPCTGDVAITRDSTSAPADELHEDIE